MNRNDNERLRRWLGTGFDRDSPPILPHKLLKLRQMNLG